MVALWPIPMNIAVAMTGLKDHHGLGLDTIPPMSPWFKRSRAIGHQSHRDSAMRSAAARPIIGDGFGGSAIDEQIWQYTHASTNKFRFKLEN